MTAWNPQPTVIINGVAHTSVSLWNVSIGYGRTSIWEQARASFANISILNTTGTDHGFDMNQVVIVKVKNSAGTDVTLFTGKITSVDNTIDASGSVATSAIQTITAVGPFADMSRKIIGGSAWPKEMDDVRMTRIFNDAGASIDVVDTPAIYEFMAVTPPVTDAYSLAASYATQAFGYIYETSGYEVGFANESHRFVDARDNGYLTIPKSYILWGGIASQKTLADITNAVSVTYRAGTEAADDLTSQATYGIVAASVNTELHNAADAQVQADRYVVLRAYPRTSLSSFTVQVDSNVVTDANRDKFLAMAMGEPIQISDLPIPIKNTTYRGFVEGYTFSINRYQMSLTLTTSDYSYSVTPTRWQDVPAALIWSAVGPTIQWDTYDD
ncbi:hypothetical protein UFOVP1144_4 [uncultured Caudovirales phage]|uniref:Uncharacterized protein n=1 Tax=uncultured Caudovirales phage TaxID=2100421 RepID=A0A6J5QP00_9CAUD|nr:hypothetical protein UFOVP1144_4 [uncultured Caudovirales phage]